MKKTVDGPFEQIRSTRSFKVSSLYRDGGGNLGFNLPLGRKISRLGRRLLATRTGLPDFETLDFVALDLLSALAKETECFIDNLTAAPSVGLLSATVAKSSKEDSLSLS